MKTLYLFLLFLCLSLAVSKAQFRFGYSLNSDMSFTISPENISGDNGFYRHADTLNIGRIEAGLARTTSEMEISAFLYNKVLHTIVTNPMDYIINLRMTTTAVDASSFMLYCPIDGGWKFVISGGVELPDGHNWAILEPGKTFEFTYSLLKNIESAALVKYSLQYFVPSTFKTGRLVKEIVIPYMIPLTE